MFDGYSIVLLHGTSESVIDMKCWVKLEKLLAGKDSSLLDQTSSQREWWIIKHYFASSKVGHTTYD
jgi:hypothetical protein